MQERLLMGTARLLIFELKQYSYDFETKNGQELEINLVQLCGSNMVFKVTLMHKATSINKTNLEGIPC